MTDPTPDPTPDPQATPPATDPPATGPPRTFTEADMNRIVQERLSRDRRERPSDEEVAALREAAEKLTQIEDANKTELEKAQAAQAAAEAKSEESTKRANATLVRAAVIAEAAKQNAVDPDAVVALVPTDAVKIDKDGEVAGAEDAVKALLEAKPYLSGAPTPPPSNDGGARTPVTPPDLAQQIADAEAKGDVREAIHLKTQQLLALPPA